MLETKCTLKTNWFTFSILEMSNSFTLGIHVISYLFEIQSRIE